MADAQKFPTISELLYLQIPRPDEPQPRLAAPLSADLTDDDIYFTVPIKDKAGNVPTAAISIVVVNSAGYPETIVIPAGSFAVDGKSAIGVKRGIPPSGLDWTTGSADFVAEHEQGSLVGCNIPAFLPTLLVSALQGLIATGGSDFIIGVNAVGTVTISRSSAAGQKKGFLRYENTLSKVQYSNNGTDWLNFDDVTASVTVKVSSNDTTPGYLQTKLVAGANVSITVNNEGANETLTIATSIGEGIEEPGTYTPAYLTGDTGAQSNVALWDSVDDGSFRITIDGTARNIDGIDFSATGPLGIVTDMDDVAAVIQHYIRAATTKTETVVWSTNKFIITSSNTTSISQVSVTSTSTGTVGTDISGAGASDWMDCDTGNGVATGPVLDQTQDHGRYPLFGPDGRISSMFIPTNLSTDSMVHSFAAGEAVDGSTTPQAVYISDGTNSRTAGRFYKADADDYTNMALRNIGFVKTNASSVGSSYDVQYGGIVGGFSALNTGETYYLSATAGGITNAVPSGADDTAIPVGIAVSATELLVFQQQSKVLGASYTFTATSSETVDTTISTGFRPQLIHCVYGTNAGGTPVAGQGEGSVGFWTSGMGTGAGVGRCLAVTGDDAAIGRIHANLGVVQIASTNDAEYLLVQSVAKDSVTIRRVGGSSVTSQTLSVFLAIYG